MKGQPYTPAEDAKIRELYASGMAQWRIGEAVGRSQSSINARIRRLFNSGGFHHIREAVQPDFGGAFEGQPVRKLPTVMSFHGITPPRNNHMADL